MNALLDFARGLSNRASYLAYSWQQNGVEITEVVHRDILLKTRH